MSDLDDMVLLADQFFAASSGEAEWEPVLTQFVDFFAADSIVLECTDRNTGKPLLVKDARVNKDCMKDYVSHYQFVSPRQALTYWQQPLTIAHDSMLINEEGMDKNPFYAEFLAGHGLRYFMSCHIDPEPHISAALALQRRADQGHVEDHDIAVFEALRPLLLRAFRQYWSLQQAGLSGDALDIMLAEFGLTPAERRLAIAVGTGERVTAYAARNGISVNTAYSHYARVKHKLECRSQRDLVLRIANLGPSQRLN